MKIKDVIAETDLTDRAIRLYIENGLVTPSCQESYTGRKNIDFSQKDVAMLKNIATLRKAGFSIPEIKALEEGSEVCRKTLEDFIRKTTDRIESDKAVVEKLRHVIELEDISVETVCENLNAVTSEKNIPEEDTKLSIAEKIEKFFFLAVGGLGIAYTLLAAVHQFFVTYYNYPMLYPRATGQFAIKLILFFYIFAVSVYYIYRYKSIKLMRPKTRRIISLVLAVILIPVCYFSAIFTMVSVLMPDFKSETTNLNKYLVIDDDAEFLSDDIESFFPRYLHPELDKNRNELEMFFSLIRYEKYPDTTRYFYRYQLVHDNDLDVTVTLQRQLSEKEFADEVEKYKNIKPDSAHRTEIAQTAKGDWKCLYYADYEENIETFKYGFCYKIFAYNESTNTVRYILEYNAGSPMQLYTVPHHMTMDWLS